jgi:hypothetical protein
MYTRFLARRRAVQQSHLSSLSAPDHAALVEAFQPLEAVNPGLPERVVRYVIEGSDVEVLAVLVQTRGPVRPWA